MLDVNKGPLVEELPPMKLIDLSSTLTEKSSTLSWGQTTGSHVFIYVIFLFILIILVGGIVCALWKYRGRWGWCSQCRREPPLDTPAPSIPLHQIEDGIYIPNTDGIVIQS